MIPERGTSTTRTGNRLAGALLAVAQFGQALWFFGNLYEAVAKIPDLLAHRRDLAVPPGEPVTDERPYRWRLTVRPAE